MRHDETKHGLSSIAWSGGNIRMPDVNMRKQKSDIISWKHMNTDYMTLVLYIKQTHSLSAPGLGPQTGSFMLTLSTMKCCRMARFGSAKPKAVNSIRKHRSMLLASNPFSWSASILASILAELQRTCHCWHRFAVFCCSETQCDAQSPFRTWRLWEIPKSSLSWIHSDLDMPKVSIWASHAAAGAI